MAKEFVVMFFVAALTILVVYGLGDLALVYGYVCVTKACINVGDALGLIPLKSLLSASLISGAVVAIFHIAFFKKYVKR